MLTLSLYLIGATFLLWFLFATLMRIRDKRDKFTRRAWQYWAYTIPGWLVLLVGYPYDIFYNLTWATLLFMQPPRAGEWTFTARLQRLVRDRISWRGRLARFFCHYLIEPWDAGHCAIPKQGG